MIPCSDLEPSLMESIVCRCQVYFSQIFTNLLILGSLFLDGLGRGCYMQNTKHVSSTSTKTLMAYSKLWPSLRKPLNVGVNPTTSIFLQSQQLISKPFKIFKNFGDHQIGNISILESSCTTKIHQDKQNIFINCLSKTCMYTL